MVPFSFAGEEFALVDGRALYWPREAALLVADLHLEKASFFARHGQMLPPYDSRETLERLAALVKQTGARRVYTLGDNFHDAGGAARVGLLLFLPQSCLCPFISPNFNPIVIQAVMDGQIHPFIEAYLQWQHSE